MGNVVYELGPGRDNPRNSEGAFINLVDGRVLFVFSRFRGETGHDDAPSDLAAVLSTDNGASWSPPGVVVSAREHEARNVMSVSLLRMNDGSIGLFYGVRMGADDIRVHLRLSSDEGQTWSEARPCMHPPGYFVVNNDRVVRLSTGRIIIPAAFHRNGFDSFDPDRRVRFDRRAVDVFFLSDDDGATWWEADTKCAMPFSRNCRSGLQEPGVVELGNGVLWAFARTDLGRQYEMFSLDWGESWTPPEPSRFTGPQSPLSVKREPQSGALVAVWNPIPNYNGRAQTHRGAWTGGRTPLVLATSTDDGASWNNELLLEDDADSGYCYTAIHFVDGAVLLGYCAGSAEDGGCLNRLRIRRLPLSVLVP
jgi:hypothetical protein